MLNEGAQEACENLYCTLSYCSTLYVLCACVVHIEQLYFVLQFGLN